MANSMICSWILIVIDPTLGTSIAYVDIARLMWENLKKRYAVSDAPKIHQLKTKPAKCKQGGLEVVEFYSKLMGLWSELENQMRFPRCACGKSECKIGERLMKMVDKEKAHQFLMGLDVANYSSIRGQILAIEPLPSLDTIFNMVHQEETHKHSMMDRDDKSEKATAFDASGKNVVIARDIPTFSHFGKFDHNDTGCFEIVGYPVGWSSRGRSRGGCSSRGGRGGRAGSSQGRGCGRETTLAAVTAGATLDLPLTGASTGEFSWANSGVDTATHEPP